MDLALNNLLWLMCHKTKNVILSYADTSTYIQNHNDTIIKQTSEVFFRKYVPLTLRVRKGLLKVSVWEGTRDRTELQYNDPHSYGHQRCVFLVLQGCSTGGPAAQLSAGWWLSLLHLISNFSGPQLIRGPKGPLRRAFSTTSYQHLLWTPTHQGLQGPLRPGLAFPTTSRL